MHRERKQFEFIQFLLILLGLACLVSAQSQSCPSITTDDLGSTSQFSSEGLVPMGIGIAAGTGETVPSIPVRIMNYTIVCDASGNRKDTSSYVSVVVQFQCDFTSTTPSLAVCDGSTIVTRQYQFQCIEDNGQIDWAASVSRDTTYVQTLNPNATLSTPLADQCRRCIDDRQASNLNIDDITHCDACGSGCNQGQGRCFVGQLGDVCCNFYLQDDCVTQCPSALVADSSFDCVCPSISLANGDVSYSVENRDIGSVANHTCSPGYQLSPQGETTRTCSTSGWSGQSFTCEQVTVIQCPELSINNGKVIILPTDRSVNSTAEYSCNGGYKLDKGDTKRTCRDDGRWSGDAPECSKQEGLSTGAIVGIIIGVIVGVILLIILVVIIALAVYFQQK